jgi:hypothetical protein
MTLRPIFGHDRKEQQMNTPTNRTHNPRLRDELGPTSRAVIAGDEAHFQEAIRSDRWERRGLLQRLTSAEPSVQESVG